MLMCCDDNLAGMHSSTGAPRTAALVGAMASFGGGSSLGLAPMANQAAYAAAGANASDATFAGTAPASFDAKAIAEIKVPSTGKPAAWEHTVRPHRTRRLWRVPQ